MRTAHFTMENFPRSYTKVTVDGRLHADHILLTNDLMLLLANLFIVMMVLADAQHPLGILGDCNIANKQILDVMAAEFLNKTIVKSLCYYTAIGFTSPNESCTTKVSLQLLVFLINSPLWLLRCLQQIAMILGRTVSATIKRTGGRLTSILSKPSDGPDVMIVLLTHEIKKTFSSLYVSNH